MRRKFSVAAVIVAVGGIVAVGVALAMPASAVANGNPVPEGKYRFSVSLTMTNIPRPDGSHYNSACSAALVAPRWIITAGHCFHDVNRNRVSGPVPYATTATVGTADTTSHRGHVVNVVSVQQSADTDVALAKLDKPVYGIDPIDVSTKVPTVGETLRITGFGATDSVDPMPSTRLRTGQMKISSVTTATIGVRGFRPLPTTSACLYDSGAPYFRERAHHSPVLVAVESDGPDCPHDQEETTSRVDLIAKWIHDTIH
jgi:secreted trypsin-like serine protease